MGVMSLICGIIPPAYVGWFFFAGSCICLGASGNVHTIPLIAYMQETISPDRMGRAFSVLTLISSVTMPIGLLFSSPIAERVGVNVWFFISGLCMIMLTTGVSIRYAAKRRREKRWFGKSFFYDTDGKYDTLSLVVYQKNSWAVNQGVTVKNAATLSNNLSNRQLPYYSVILK